MHRPMPGQGRSFDHEPVITHTLRLGGHRPALRRLPRHRVGRARSTTTAALRVPHPRRRAGRAELDHHPQEARELPPGLRRLRSGAVARFDAKKVRALLADAGIVRNRLKIDSAIGNAGPSSRSRKSSAAFEPTSGASSAASHSGTEEEPRGRLPARTRIRCHEQGPQERAASASSDRPSATHSCRRREW